MTNDNRSSNNNSTDIVLVIKSLEHQVRSVAIQRNATVLELKGKIQSAFDVESIRQRLIFQGKVLKDDKSLSDYENLNDGKVVHLVVRPLNAPRNPENDEPQRSSNSTGNHLTSGYAVITVDASLSDLTNGGSALSNFFRNLYQPLSGSPSPSLSPQNSPFSPSGRPSPTRAGLAGTRAGSGGRSFDYIRQGRRPGLDGLLDMLDSRSSPIQLPIPSSMELRLSRTLAYINEVRALLNTSTNEFEANSQQNFNNRSTNIPVSALEMRGRLNQEPNPSSQVALVVNELADLFQHLVPYFTHLGSLLRDETSANPQRQLAEILKAARVIQILSLSNHFLGSILTQMEISPENYNNNNNTTRTETTSASSSSNTPAAEGSSNDNKRKRDSDEGSSASSKQKLD